MASASLILISTENCFAEFTVCSIGLQSGVGIQCADYTSGKRKNILTLGSTNHLAPLEGTKLWSGLHYKVRSTKGSLH